MPLCRSKYRVFQSFLIALVLLAGAFTASPARADLQLCNDTEALVGVAVGYKSKTGWVTEGWWRIPASACAAIIEGKLAQRYFYLHAEEAETGGQWRGPVEMCTSAKQFSIKGVKDCFARGYERNGFFEVDTGDQTNWQVRLTDADRKPGPTEGTTN